MQNGQDQRIEMTWAAQSAEPPVSIMALHGLGKELWEEVDAQAYVDQLRREWERTEMTEAWQEYPIDVLSLSIRPYNALRRAGISTLGQLITCTKLGTLCDVRNFGAKASDEVEGKLRAYLDSLDDVDTEATLAPEQKTVLADTPSEIPPPLSQTCLCPAWHLYPITHLNLSLGSFNLLLKHGYTTLGMAALLAEKAYPKDVGIKGFGFTKLWDLQKSLETYLANLPESDLRLVDPTCELSLVRSNEADLDANENIQAIPFQDEIENWLNSLYNERDRVIITWRYGLENDPLTLEEVGQKLGVTRERIRQIEHKALQRLRRSKKNQILRKHILTLVETTFNDAGGILTNDEIVAIIADCVP